MSVHVLGVRHHGPGSARSVGAALRELAPDAVVIEGAPELDAVAALAGDPELRPPVAGLVYDRERPRRAAFYPLAEFSPEWVALRYAVARGIPVRFADLPAAVSLATTDDAEGDGGAGGDGGAADLLSEDTSPASTTGPMEDGEPGDPDTGPMEDGESGDQGGAMERSDPIAVIARAAGYADPERWWEDAVEHRTDSATGRFAAVSEAMRLVRDARPELDDLENQRREAAMRRVIREVAADHERVVVVCGAFHAPALEPTAHPAKSADAKLLAGLAKVKVGVTWAPWTNDRLRLASGYGAGVNAPGWYHHLFTTASSPDGFAPDGFAPDVAAPHDVPDGDAVGDAAGDAVGDADRAAESAVTTGWVVKVARTLRDQQLDAAPASAVETVRLAEALAAVRGRPAAGLEELDDAALTVLCEGQETRLELVRPSLYIGDELGTVPDATPMVPLAADFAATVRSLRLKQSAVATTVTLDLRQPSQLARSTLLHRLRVLGVDWGVPTVTGRTTGTFKEAWELLWRPELSVAVIEASLHGTTIAGAAAAVVTERARVADLAGLSALVEVCLVADLPDGLATVVEQLGVRSAHSHDIRELLNAVEPLARTVRYGDVRGAPTSDVRHLLEVIVLRACVGLPAGCQALDDDLAVATRRVLDRAHHGVTLLQDRELTDPWWAALQRLGPDVHGTVGGRVDRLLLDAGERAADAAAERMARRLSDRDDTAAAATWLEAFLGGEALLLLHDRTLFGLVDDWVSGIPEELFDDVLPLVRRTFATFSAPERQQVAAVVLARGGEGARQAQTYAAAPDLRRAAAALATTARLLGLARHTSGFGGDQHPGTAHEEVSV